MTSRTAPPSRPASFCDLDDCVASIRDRCGFHRRACCARKTKDQRCTQTDYPRLHARFFLILSQNQIIPGCKPSLSGSCLRSVPPRRNSLISCVAYRELRHIFTDVAINPPLNAAAGWALIAPTLTKLEVYFLVLRLLAVRPDPCLHPVGAVSSPSSTWTRWIIALPPHLRYRANDRMTITTESEHATAR
jgi:hypothetical protein